MATDEKAAKDKWDALVTTACPKCEATIRLRQTTVNRGTVVVRCPECETSFDYPPSP